MIVSREDLGDILSGEVDEVVIDRLVRVPEIGLVAPVRVKGGRPRCWVCPVEVWRHQEGGWVVRFTRAPAPHTPRLLARTGRAHLPSKDDDSGSQEGAEDKSPAALGYTSSPFRALGDEPECVPEAWQQEFSAERSQRDQLLRVERVAARRVERWRNKRQRKRAA